MYINLRGSRIILDDNFLTYTSLARIIPITSQWLTTRKAHQSLLREASSHICQIQTSFVCKLVQMR